MVVLHSEKKNCFKLHIFLISIALLGINAQR